MTLRYMHVSCVVQISVSLSEFHTWVSGVIRNACEEALQAEDFVPDPIDDQREGIATHTLIIPAQQVHINNSCVCVVVVASPQPGVTPFPMMDQIEVEQPHIVQLDPKEKLSYTEQAAKRKLCQRLTRYVHALYLI